MRDRDVPVADALERAIAGGTATLTEPVAMELLAGARDAAHEHELRALIASVPLLPVGGLDTWESAAAIYRACRRAGVPVRGHVDCLIAAVAIREDVEVLHADRDFDLIARHVPLRLARI